MNADRLGYMLKSRLLRGLAATLIALAAAVLLLPWWFPTGWIRERIAREASTALGSAVSIGKVSLFWTGAEIADLTIENPPSFPGGPLLTVQRIRVAVPLAGLLRGKSTA